VPILDRFRLDGRRALVTGGSRGLGRAMAQALAEAGADLVLVGRNRRRGDAAVARIKAKAPQAAVTMHYANLSLMEEVRRLADELGALPRIDVLINNAGAVFDRREVTTEGLERTFALNHMAYFLLTALLLDQLKAAAPSRIVSVASEAHRGAALDPGDLQNARNYRPLRAYGRSKLANILFTAELARRLEGSGVTANCLHPGFVASSFGDNTGLLFRLGFGLLKRMAAITPERGADTIVFLASAPEVASVSGRYFDKRRAVAPSAAAQDETAARRLWEESERLAGLKSEATARRGDAVHPRLLN
jgi:NAD(P)-dependent dehydrogenase (short-subunit alcohol dehydrogenase family)